MAGRGRPLFGARVCPRVALLAGGLATTRFGAHLYAVGGNAEGARLAASAPIRHDRRACRLQPDGRRHGALSGEPAAFRARPGSGATASTISKSIAVVVIGGTLLAAGEAASGEPSPASCCSPRSTRRSTCSACRPIRSCPARRDRRRRRRRLYGAHAGSMSRDDRRRQQIGRGSRAVALIAAHQYRGRRFRRSLSSRRAPPAVLSGAGRRHEFPAPRRAAGDSRVRPGVRAGRRRFRSFDRVAGDAHRDRRIDARPTTIPSTPGGRSARSMGSGSSSGSSTAWSSRICGCPVDHRDARHAAVGQRRGDDVVGRLAARLPARQFPHVRPARAA